MSDQTVEVAKWYTRARRFPQLIGKTPDGAKLPGGPYTFTQVGVFVGVFVVGLKTTHIWGAFGLLGNFAVLFGVAYGACFAAGRVPVGARNPFSVGASVLRAVAAPAGGRYRGSPIRPKRPHPISARLVIADTPRSVASLAGSAKSVQQEAPAPPPVRQAQSTPSPGPLQAPSPPLTGIQLLLASSATHPREN